MHEFYLDHPGWKIDETEDLTLSEETAQPTVYHHLSQVSVDMQLSGMIKCRENSGVLMQVTLLIFRTLSWVLPE